MEQIVLEIRDAEGGEDAKLLVKEMKNIYIKASNNNSFIWRVEEERKGFVSLCISGNNVKKVFKNEIGSHRWQRVPPTEKRGRIQTSTITVALVDCNAYEQIVIPKDEIRIETTRGTGNGGQHKNSTDSCVIMTHIPTKIKVVRDGRSQITNREYALIELTKRVNDSYQSGYMLKNTEARRGQVGDGSRSDKRRTYREKDEIVIDHITNKKASFNDILKGKIELLK